MRMKVLGFTIAVAFAVAFAGCSSKPKAPPRDSLVALLQQEAEALKAENENKDVNLGVRTVWKVASVDVQEQPENAEAPWRGSIRFKIRAETSDMDGKVQVDEQLKEFAYVFNPVIEKWVFEYK